MLVLFLLSFYSLGRVLYLLPGILILPDINLNMVEYFISHLHF